MKHKWLIGFVVVLGVVCSITAHGARVYMRSTRVLIEVANCTSAAIGNVKLEGTEADGRVWPSDALEIPPGKSATLEFSRTSGVAVSAISCSHQELNRGFNPPILIGGGQSCRIELSALGVSHSLTPP